MEKKTKQPYWRTVFSPKHNLSLNVPSNSRFRTVRELEAGIKTQLLPVFVLIRDKKDEDVKLTLESLAVKMSEEGSRFWKLYMFGLYLGRGLIADPENISIDQFTKLLNANMYKATFGEVIKGLPKVLNDFFVSFKEKSGDAINLLAKNLNSCINSLSHNLVETGIVNSILEGKRPEDVKVIKIVWPGACKYCAETYLHPDGTPKVFTVKELLDNGYDLFRKPEDYKPVISSLHFNCRCTLAPIKDDVDPLEAYSEYIVNYTLAMREFGLDGFQPELDFDYPKIEY